MTTDKKDSSQDVICSMFTSLSTHLNTSLLESKLDTVQNRENGLIL